MTIKTILRKRALTKWAAKDSDGKVYEYVIKPDKLLWCWVGAGGWIPSKLKIPGPWQQSLRRIIDKPKAKK